MSVLQADEEELGLSEDTLRALKEFASLNLGLDPNAADFRRTVQDAMDTIPRDENFTFNFTSDAPPTQPGAGDAVTIELSGVSPELGQTLASTGLTVWTAARHLAHYLFHIRDQIAGRTVIELGAGLGLCGILCAKLGASVVVTDGGDEFTEEALGALTEQVERNRSVTAAALECAVERLTWGDHDAFLKAHREGFDVVIAADVIYEADAVAPLLSTVTALLQAKPRARFLLGYTHRNVNIDRVWQEAQARGLDWREIADDFSGSESAAQIYEVRLKEEQ
eukprot:TRINITY_DN16274_c0_g1_i1.p1 TRINITY_DN16274_c0_g1~~TRINITY_DN16274_c0_g1_i1.p1  ORF type:complete len:296 (-),score=68.01 TRINITY_DN16274_c0_g1_i1:23-862(-)